MPNAEQIRAVVESYLSAVASGEPERVAELYAPDATLEDPVGSDVRRGHEAITKFYGATRGAKMTTTLKELRAVANEATFLFEVVTEVGDQTYVISPIDHMVFDDDGKIRSMRAFWSDTDMSVR